MFRYEQGECEERKPTEGLSPSAGENELAGCTEVPKEFHRRQLRHHPDQLG